MISSHLSDRVRKFFRKARNSLRAANEVDLSADDPPTDRVCFDCQMCAEFALKTFLLSHGREYRKYGHNLSETLDACVRLDPSFSGIEDFCESLDGYRGVAEYSFEESAFPPVEVAEKALENARKVHEFVTRMLKDTDFLDG